MMDLENIKTKAKGFWSEYKYEIIHGGIGFGLGITISKMISCKLNEIISR